MKSIGTLISINQIHRKIHQTYHLSSKNMDIQCEKNTLHMCTHIQAYTTSHFYTNSLKYISNAARFTKYMTLSLTHMLFLSRVRLYDVKSIYICTHICAHYNSKHTRQTASNDTYTATCKIDGNFQRFSTDDLYEFSTETPSERIPFIFQVAVTYKRPKIMHARQNAWNNTHDIQRKHVIDWHTLMSFQTCDIWPVRVPNVSACILVLADIWYILLTLALLWITLALRGQ